jgi:hypothetical protein
MSAWLSSIGQSDYVAVAIMVPLVSLIVAPIMHHVFYGLARQEADIDASLNTDAKRMYLEIFQAHPDLQDPVVEFRRLYQQWYGRRRLLWPTVILVMISIPVLFFLARTLVGLNQTGDHLDKNIAALAIAGAYTFVVAEIISGVQRRSLRLVDISRSSLRLASAVPIGFAFTALPNKELAPFIAFALGAFPLDAVRITLRRIANKQFNLEIGATDAPEQVRKLSGIDHAVADRIAEADITTISQLAWCDPIQLAIRTNLNFGYIVDLVSQSLAWVYLEDRLDLLRPFGLRGGFEIRVFVHDDLKSRNPRTKEAAETVAAEAAKPLNMSVPSLLYTFEQISEDRATKFLTEVA